MNKLEMWVKDGTLVTRPVKPDGTQYSDRVLFDTFHMVRVLSDDQGTHLQWNMTSANWSSLLFVANFVAACPAPFSLRYFNTGWFVEHVNDAREAANRIEALIFKSDVRLSQRAFTQDAPLDMATVPDVLKEAMKSCTVADENAIVCNVDMTNEVAQVEHVGNNSLIAKIWGQQPNSYPLMQGHSYDRAVTPNYFQVAATGKPHYDHVLAAMLRPDGEVHWIGYHRVIVPDLFSPVTGSRRVKIVSELAPVGIQLL